MNEFLLKARRYRPHATFVLVNVIFAAVFIVVLLSAFHSPRPHDLPIGVVAPAGQAQRVQEQLDSHLSGGFKLTSYPSAAAADDAIRHRDIDAALVLEPSGPQLRTAAAGGSALTSAVMEVFDQVAGKSGKPLAVVDVVPSGSGDTSALTSFFTVLGVLFPSLAAGVGSALLFRRSRPVWCLGALVVVAIAAGVVASAVADGMADIGDFWSVAGVLALFSLAISASAAAFARIKAPLASVGLLLFVVVGLPVSVGTSGLAPFGSGYLRAFDDWLPLGVAANTVRNIVYFDGNDIANHLCVLGIWAAAGLAAVGLLTTVKARQTTTTAADDARLEVELEEFAPVQAAMFDRAVQVAAAEKAAGKIVAKPPIRNISADAPAGRPAQIVIGFDNSDSAHRALRWAIDLLSSRPGSLAVIYVGPLPAPNLNRVRHLGHRPTATAQYTPADAASVALAAVADIAKGGPATWRFEHRHGDAAEMILTAAAEHSHAPRRGETETLIVVGRASGRGRHEIGSVPVTLLEHSMYPVIVIS